MYKKQTRQFKVTRDDKVPQKIRACLTYRRTLCFLWGYNILKEFTISHKNKSTSLYTTVDTSEILKDFAMGYCRVQKEFKCEIASQVVSTKRVMQ